MTSISYETIFSRSRLKMNDLRELMTLSNNDLTEINVERLHSVISDVRIQYVFSEFEMDDDIQTIKFELNNPNKTFFDKEFVIDILALGMVITWLRPQVENHEYVAMMIGGKEEKSLNNQYSKIKERLEQLETKQYKLLRDRGYLYNDYLKEES